MKMRKAKENRKETRHIGGDAIFIKFFKWKMEYGKH
jgi:hypothetical protein